MHEPTHPTISARESAGASSELQRMRASFSDEGKTMVRTIDVVAEAIETLCTVEMRERGPNHGVIRRLYESARAEQGRPPTSLATEGLLGSVKGDDVVIVATGAFLPDHLPKGETDGPPAAASLAYALRLGLGAHPVILCEEQVIDPVEAACRAIGLGIRPLEIALRLPFAAAVDSFPADGAAEDAAHDLLETLEPKAVITVERLGLNEKGVAHSSTGLPVAVGRARIEVLVSAARDAGILTIGIGDNGNEIGFGRIVDAVRQYKPYGHRCRCPCDAGIACVDVCDVLVVSAISNWGAYGLAACLSVALEIPELIHDAATELRMIDACVRAGAADGLTGMYTPSVDGVPGCIHGYVVEMLRLIVRKSLAKTLEREF